MRNLERLQDQFQNYLLTNQREIQKSIVNTEKVSVDQRLFIYLDGYRCRLIDCLAANFPMLSSYLGFDDFSALAMDYMALHPSSFRSIRWFGDKLPAFLKLNNQPFLAELAEFEWSMTLAFDAADETTLKVEEMATIPPKAWATIRFKPHASLNLMNFNWNTVEIWEALSNESKPPKPKNTKSETWVLWRRDYINRYYSLTVDEAWAIDALIKGKTFGELCEGLCHWFDEEEVGRRAASLLKGWIEFEMITGILS